MKRILLLIAALTLLLSASLNRAAMRINGNQLLESAIAYDRDAVARAQPSAVDCLAVVPHKLIMNLGQGLSGAAAEPGQPRFGTGLGYDIAEVVYEVFGPVMCPVAMTGDVNLSGNLTSADVIYLVNFVFKGQADHLPCAAAGDVNCSENVTSADIIYMVNHVFKGQPEPCDICTLIPSQVSCP